MIEKFTLQESVVALIMTALGFLAGYTFRIIVKLTPEEKKE